jgi:hypothetical protein
MQRQIETSGATINLVTGGSGPPLLCSKPGKKSGIVASITLQIRGQAMERLPPGAHDNAPGREGWIGRWGTDFS